MSAKLEKIENGIAELTIEVDAAKFDEGMSKAYAKTAKRFAIPGFRKGKAPRKMVEQYYGEGVLYEEAVNIVCPDAYDEAIDELKLEPVDRPEIDIVTIGGGQNLVFTAKVILKPEVKLGKYKGIEIEKTEYNVSDEDIMKEIEATAERNSRIITVEDRAIAEGDIAVIDFEGFKDGVAFEGGSGKDYDLTIGSGQFIPGFEEQLVGKNIGEDVSVNVTFPEDYHAEELKGAAVEFKVKVNGIKVKEVPAIDDELAKDASDFDTLDEWKKSVAEKLEKNAEAKQKAEIENKAVEMVSKKTKVEIPDCMIETQTEQMIRDYEMRLMQQGLSLDMYLKYTNSTVDALKEQFKDQAKTQVITTLTLEAIAKKEEIKAADEDIEAEYKTISEMYKMDIEEVKKIVRPESLADDITMRKTVEFIVANAKIK